MDRMEVVIILLLTTSPLVVNLLESSEKCIVTHSPTTTTYNISELSINMNCPYYQWYVNGTAKANENDRGLGSSPSFFTTLGCMKKVCVKIECPPDQDKMSCCSYDCLPAQQLDGHAKPPTQPPTDEDVKHGVGIGVPVIGLLVIVLLVWCRAKMKKRVTAKANENEPGLGSNASFLTTPECMEEVCVKMECPPDEDKVLLLQ